MTLKTFKEFVVSEGLEHQKLAKKIMGSSQRVDHRAAEQGHHSWDQNRGHAGATYLSGIRKRAAALGFKNAESKSGGSADGYVTNNSNDMVHPDGHTLSTYSSYGATSDYNRFSARLKMKHDK